jgi:hypothetical protein
MSLLDFRLFVFHREKNKKTKCAVEFQTHFNICRLQRDLVCGVRVFWPGPYLFFSKPHRHSGGGGRRQTKTQRNQLGTRINKMGKERKRKRGKNRVKCGMKAPEVRVTSTTAAAQHKTLPAYVCVYNQGADGSVCPPIRKTNEAASSAAEQQYIYVSNSFIFFSFLF